MKASKYHHRIKTFFFTYLSIYSCLPKIIRLFNCKTYVWHLCQQKRMPIFESKGHISSNKCIYCRYKTPNVFHLKLTFSPYKVSILYRSFQNIKHFCNFNKMLRLKMDSK